MSRGATVARKCGMGLGVKALTKGAAFPFAGPHQVGEVGFQAGGVTPLRACPLNAYALVLFFLHHKQAQMALFAAKL